jgi:hypothetical protein
MAIQKNYLVEKRNILNEVRSNNMTLQELRFFTIYLARINSRDINTRVVRFSLEEYQKIMDLGRLNLMQLQNSADSLLSKVVGITLETGGFRRFQLFKRTEFSQDENKSWYIEINAHDDALPLMFEFKERYFTYELWNALQLKSSNQLRMYEILKQYEKIGERIISIAELKELLGLKKSDYMRFNNFKTRVLDSCQEALETYTDIKFVCTPAGKLGMGGKIINLKFTISHNDNYVDPLSLSDFIDLKDAKLSKYDDMYVAAFANDRLEFLADACAGEFSETEIQVLFNLIIQIIPHKIGEAPSSYQLKTYDYLKHRYDELKMRAERNEIKNRFGYLKKMLEVEVKTQQELD